MNLSRKQIYWGIGITTGLATLALIGYRHRKGIAHLVGDAQSSLADWLKPVFTKISSPFGYRTNPVTNEHQFHNGVDLPTPVNTKVKSPMSGIVEKVYNNPAGGNQLIIKHDNGYTTGYAHLTKATVKVGDRVKQGDTIALSGNTGRSTGPHVHFTLKNQKGDWMDPAKVVYGIA